MIDEFIKSAMSQLGVSEQSAKGATGGLLSMIQKNATGDDFSKLLNVLPGADGLLKQFGGATPSGGGGGGLLGSVLGAVGGKLPGGLGQAAGLLGMLSGHGIPADKAGGFVNLFASFVKGKGGEQLIGNLLSGFPDLKKLLG
jgi:hypothetical protein